MSRDEKIKLQRIHLVSAIGDFELANSAAAFLSDVDENENYRVEKLRRFRCFEHTAIVAYARPFVPARGNKVPALSLKQIGANLEEDSKKLHDKLIELRNKLVAHSDIEMMNFAAKTHAITEANGADFYGVFPSYDEGLQFYKLKSRIALTGLIKWIHFRTYKTISDQAQSDPEAFNLGVHTRNE